MKIINGILLAALVSQSIALADEPISERTFEVNSLKMTISDLDEILGNVRSLISNANVDASNDWFSERISLTHDGNTIKLQRWNSLGDERVIPNYITEIWYWYRAKEGAPINSVSINLSNSYRKIIIEGKDRNIVDAISAVLRDKFEIHNSYLSSNSIKRGGAIILMTVGIVLVFFRKVVKGVEEPVISINLIGSFCFLAPTILPWSKWLPGVAIYGDTANFIDRHINQITVFGVFLGLVGIAFNIYFGMFRKKKI